MTSLFLFEERESKTIWRLTAGVRSFDFAQDDIGRGGMDAWAGETECGVRSFDFAQDDIGRGGMDAWGMVLEGLGWVQGEGD